MKTKLALFIVVAVIMLVQGCATPPGPTSILIVTGGHGFEQEPFFQMFDELNVTWQHVVQPRANQMIAADSVAQFDVLVFYDMYQEITPEQQKAWFNLVDKGKGKGIVFFHHCLASYQNWNDYDKIIGGKYMEQADSMHTASTYRHDVKVPIHVMDPEHPVTKGLTDFTLFDEVYGNFYVNETVTPLLSTSHPESGKIIAWTQTVGKSKVVYLQPGHDHHAYEDPNFKKLLIQAIDYVK